jgi:FtsP/CotA-like multicopper oxidase with cupredoxin domain
MVLDYLPVAVVLAAVQIGGFAQDAGVCPRFPAGSTVTAPQDLFSENGVLQVNFSYQTAVDENGNTLFCFITESGAESPTLHVRPGDRLQITLTNHVPEAAASNAMSMAMSPAAACGATTMTATSVNIHYHGTNTPPTCHQDEVIRTMVNSGESFRI